MFKVFLTLLLLSNACFAGDSVVLSSFTDIATSGLRIERTNQGDKIVAVVIGSCGGPAASVSIFDSSATTNPHERIFEVIATSGAAGSYNCDATGTYSLFDRHISSGITYSVVGNPDVTILWKDVSPGDGQ